MIDYTTIQQQVRNLLAAATYTDTIKEHFIEAMDRDLLLGNMPFTNVRLDKALMEIRSLPNGYYGYLLFKIDVGTFDLSEFKKAAIVRNRILREAQLYLQANRKFGASVETSSIGPEIEFLAGTVEDGELTKGHIATATFDFVVEVFIEPT
jgi:hypothetical protein